MGDIDRLRVKLKEALKADIIVPMAEEKDTHTFIPSGIADLDLKLGGGWPTGCMNVLFGPKSSGKSIIGLLTIAAAQRTCRKCYRPFNEKVKCACKKAEGCTALYVNAENSWTNKWSKALGIKEEDVYIANPRHLEEAFNTVDICIREESVDVIVFDSIAGLAPKAETESTMEEWQTGLIPRVYSKFLRKWASELMELRVKGKKLPMTLILNQIRMKVGVMYGNPEIMPGGEAQQFFASTIVRVTKKGIEMSADNKEDPQPMFQSVRYVIEKSKVGPVRREGQFDVVINKHLDEKGIRRDVGYIDNTALLLEYARRFNLFGDKPGVYKFGGKDFKTLEDLIKNLDEDVGFRWEVTQATNRAYDEYVPSALSISKMKKLDNAKEETGKAATA